MILDEVVLIRLIKDRLDQTISQFGDRIGRSSRVCIFGEMVLEHSWRVWLSDSPQLLTADIVSILRLAQILEGACLHEKDFESGLKPGRDRDKGFVVEIGLVGPIRQLSLIAIDDR